jgi:hypothetical protein
MQLPRTELLSRFDIVPWEQSDLLYERCVSNGERLWIITHPDKYLNPTVAHDVSAYVANAPYEDHEVRLRPSTQICEGDSGDLVYQIRDAGSSHGVVDANASIQAAGIISGAMKVLTDTPEMEGLAHAIPIFSSEHDFLDDNGVTIIN